MADDQIETLVLNECGISLEMRYVITFGRR